MSGFDFEDTSEFDTGAESPVDEGLPENNVDDIAQNVLDILVAQEEEQQLDDDLTEIEKRMEVAAYYNCLLKDSIFGADSSHAARIVTHRIKRFVKAELSELVGLTAPKAAAPALPLFSDVEIAALKALAAKVIGKPSVMEAAVLPKRGPQLNTVVKTAPSLPVSKPTIPTVKTQRGPGFTPPTAPARPQAKPQQLVKKQQGKGKRFVELAHPLIPGEVIQKDVSRQNQPSGPIKPLAMPMGDHMTAVTEQQAQIVASKPSLANANKVDGGKIQNQIATAISLSLRE